MFMEWHIEVKDLWFSYIKGEYVLKGTNFEAKPGEITALVGPTGCGKSTLLLIIAGLLKPLKGEVYYNGNPLSSILPNIRRYIGLLFQDPDAQLFNSTVYDEIAYALRSLGWKEEVRAKALSIATNLGLRKLLHRPPFRLSVGEKKKVALASILVYDPNVLLLDEPTANLDGHSVSVVKNTILNAKDERKTVIIALHDIGFVVQVADVIYVMCDGEIKRRCRVYELLDDEVIKEVNLPLPVFARVLKRMNIDVKDLIRFIRETNS